MFKTILLPVDGSESSGKCFDYARNIARVYGSKVIILNVFELPLIIEPYQVSPNIFEQVTRELKINSKNLLEQNKDEFSDLNIEELSVEGQPGLVIKQVADEKNVDLVIMGSRGLGTIQSFLLGSVSNYVIHHVKCPVIVIK